MADDRLHAFGTHAHRLCHAPLPCPQGRRPPGSRGSGRARCWPRPLRTPARSRGTPSAANPVQPTPRTNPGRLLGTEHVFGVVVVVVAPSWERQEPEVRCRPRGSPDSLNWLRQRALATGALQLTHLSLSARRGTGLGLSALGPCTIRHISCGPAQQANVAWLLAPGRWPDFTRTSLSYRRCMVAPWALGFGP